MLSKLVDVLFGCTHANYTFPRTSKFVHSSTGIACGPRTYVVCLDCGKDLPYDWQEMRIALPEKKVA
jgi:hypothetical protein